jgi:hypothetical protein
LSFWGFLGLNDSSFGLVKFAHVELAISEFDSEDSFVFFDSFFELFSLMGNFISEVSLAFSEIEVVNSKVSS